MININLYIYIYIYVYIYEKEEIALRIRSIYFVSGLASAEWNWMYYQKQILAIQGREVWF